MDVRRAVIKARGLKDAHSVGTLTENVLGHSVSGFGGVVVGTRVVVRVLIEVVLNEVADVTRVAEGVVGAAVVPLTVTAV